MTLIHIREISKSEIHKLADCISAFSDYHNQVSANFKGCYPSRPGDTGDITLELFAASLESGTSQIGVVERAGNIMGFCKIGICHNTGKLNYLVVLKEHSGNGCGKKILFSSSAFNCFPSLPSVYKGKHENEIPSFLVYSDLLNLILNIAKNPFSCNADLIMSSNIVMEECDELSEKAPVERIFFSPPNAMHRSSHPDRSGCSEVSAFCRIGKNRAVRETFSGMGVALSVTVSPTCYQFPGNRKNLPF